MTHVFRTLEPIDRAVLALMLADGEKPRGSERRGTRSAQRLEGCNVADRLPSLDAVVCAGSEHCPYCGTARDVRFPFCCGLAV